MSKIIKNLLAKKLTEQSLHKFTIEAMIKYGTEVIENRALPDFRDGLKPGQRLILWAMDQATPRIHSNGPTVKSSRVVGECFTAGTPISTPDGEIPIETLEVNDLVNTSQGPRPVVALIHNPPVEMFKLTLDNGRWVVTTKNQCVKVKQNDKFIWKPVCDLTEDDAVVVELDT